MGKVGSYVKFRLNFIINITYNAFFLSIKILKTKKIVFSRDGQQNTTTI